MERKQFITQNKNYNNTSYNPEGHYNEDNRGGYNKGGFNKGGNNYYNGDKENRGYQKGGQFNQKGAGNHYGGGKDFNSQRQVVPANRQTTNFSQGGKVNVITNQFQMRLGQELSVFLYDCSITPEVMNDQHLNHTILRMCKKKLEFIMGIYVISGKNIFSTTDLQESFKLKVLNKGVEYEVFIDANTKHFFSGESLSHLKMEDHNVAHTLINIIIKEAFRQTHLRQIGKTPRFFDISKAIEIEGTDLQVWPGFRASAFNYTSGLALVIDNVNKFMSTKSVLQRIYEITDSCPQNPQNQILREFKGQSVIANWGNKKAYIVHDLVFDKNPTNMFFEDGNGKKVCVAEYFQKTYNMRITDKEQALLVVKMGGKDIHLPTEFCTIDGVPDSFRQDKSRMRNVLGACRKNPEEKIHEIQEFSQTLFGQKSLKDWGIEVDATPVHMEAQVLPTPELIFANGSTSLCDQNTLRRLPIQKAVNLLANKWIIAYDKQKHFKDADYMYSQMCASCSSLNLYVEEPSWIELNNERDTDKFEEQLFDYIRQFGQPVIVVIVLRSEHLYNAYKNICYSYNVVSQVVSARTCAKMSLSVASNVLRQINSKLGGDLYNMAFPKEISPNTMLIGIDVCHQGQKSIVGFCASINPQQSQYYSQRIIQKRGQEIVTKELTDNVKIALKSYSERHPKKLYPDHFIIYRDGVGDAMRQQVLQKEITQFKKAIDEVYNKAAKKPVLTVIIVNKRITQRFFLEDERGGYINPPSGCIIDKGLVENSDSTIEYDFFLIPQFTTQGCVLPTHFYVAFNDSKLSKDVVEKFTFALCHYYYNWAGPIKVPAPCMYAHKIAELFMNIGEGKADKDKKPKAPMTKQVCESLHFL